VYGWVDQTLRQQRYEGLLRSERGLVRRYVEKMTGLSRAQTTRLITVYVRGDEVKPQPYQRRRFAQRYTREDIALLAGVDEAHETLSGPATKKLLQRACYNFHETRYQSLARISVAQLYRLRGSRAYRERRIKFQATRPTQGSIGERRKPEGRGRPGRDQGSVPHQRGGRGDAMGSGRVGGADQRSLSATDAEGHAGAVSVPHSGLPFRQRQRVHQPHGGRVTEQAADRADQIPTAALQRQWAGREQERRGGAEVDGVHAYCRAARSGDHGVFPRAPEPILELSPTVRGAGVGSERQGKGEASVPMVRDAMGDPAATAGRGQPSQGRGNDSDAGSTGAGQERYAGGGRNAASET